MPDPDKAVGDRSPWTAGAEKAGLVYIWIPSWPSSDIPIRLGILELVHLGLPKRRVRLPPAKREKAKGSGPFVGKPPADAMGGEGVHYSSLRTSVGDGLPRTSPHEGLRDRPPRLA